MDLALKEDPQSYPLLHVQCDFLRSKGQLDWAVKLAREAVNCAPSEFVTWAKLTEVYIELGEYESVRLFAPQIIFVSLLYLFRLTLDPLNDLDTGSPDA